MARILLCVEDDALQTALLRQGHQVFRTTLPKGGLAVMAQWQFRRLVAGFRPDFLLGAAGDAQAADTARQLGARFAAPPGDVAFLADHWLSPPFIATPALPAIVYGGGVVPLAIEGAERGVLHGEGMPPVAPEIAALGSAAPGLLAGMMGAGAVVVAADLGEVRRYVADGLTGHVYPAGDMAALGGLLRGLVDDAARRKKMAAAARAAFLARHRAAHAALRDAFGQVFG